MHNPVVITSIVTKASTYDLVTLSDVKMLLDITASDEDAYLAWVITQISLAAAQVCNRVFPAETVTDSFWPQRDGYPIAKLGDAPPAQLTRWPVQSVTSITESIGGVASPLVADVDYKLDAANGRLYRLDSYGYPTKWYGRALIVTYDGGFDPIPQDLAGAAVAWCKAVRAARTRDSGLRSERITGVYDGSWVIGGAVMPDETAAVFGSYTVPLG